MAKMEKSAFDTRATSVNGYHYHVQSLPLPPTPEIIQKGLGIWESEFVPRIRETCERVRSRDYDSMSAAELADSIEEIFAGQGEMFRYTMMMVLPFMGPTYAMLAFAEEKLGPEADQILAALLQGFDNGSADAGARLGELADFARAYPELASALAEGRHEDLENMDGGLEFLARFREYLAEYGWRAESWGLPHVPTWAEDPTIPLTLIGRYATSTGSGPAEAMARAKQQHEAAMAEVESKLSGDDLAEFKKRLETCQLHVPISEGRARWQLTIVGSARVPAIALGKKLVGAGALEEPNDVWFLSLEELRAIARDPRPETKDLVAQRKADLDRWESLTPPPFLGVPPEEPPPAVQAIGTKFFGLGVVPSTDPRVVKGNPASRGTARGTARIIRDLSESGKLQQGDILVCPSTAPPWTPLFAIAAAVVTDTGGILSHSAICAREYGIPCVVGTQVGTSQIPDGATVTVDATEGTIHLE
jgi:pyruvate,water dikinase